MPRGRRVARSRARSALSGDSRFRYPRLMPPAALAVRPSSHWRAQPRPCWRRWLNRHDDPAPPSSGWFQTRNSTAPAHSGPRRAAASEFPFRDRGSRLRQPPTLRPRPNVVVIRHSRQHSASVILAANESARHCGKNANFGGRVLLRNLFCNRHRPVSPR